MNQRQKIKSISALPKWFDLKKYQAAKHLNAAGWYEQITVRDSCLSFANKIPMTDWVSESLRQLRATPIINLTDNRLIILLGGGVLSAMKNSSPEHTATLLGVHPTTVRELFWAVNKMTKGRRLYAERFASQVFGYEWGTDKPFIYVLKDWIDYPVSHSTQKEYRHGDNFLTVNMNLPDKVLIEHFKKFLAGARSKNKTTHKPKRHRELFYKDWIAFGVLPFLDLQIWSKERGLTITNRVIADAIFPAGSGGEEVVRKTTIPLVNKVLGNKIRDILEAKAALELAESYEGDKFPEV